MDSFNSAEFVGGYFWHIVTQVVGFFPQTKAVTVLLGVGWDSFCLLTEQAEINKWFLTDPRLKLFGICNKTSQFSFNLNGNTKKELITFCIIFVFGQQTSIAQLKRHFPCSPLGELYAGASAGFWKEIQSWKGAFLSPWTIPGTRLPPEGNPDPLRLERSISPTPLLRLGTPQSREGHLRGKGRQCLAFGISYFLLFWVLVQWELYCYRQSTCPWLGAATLWAWGSTWKVPHKLCARSPRRACIPGDAWTSLSITRHRGSPEWARHGGGAWQTQSSWGSLWPASVPGTAWTAAGDGRITFIPLVPARSPSQGALPLKRRSKIPPLPLARQFALRNSCLAAQLCGRSTIFLLAYVLGNCWPCCL